MTRIAQEAVYDEIMDINCKRELITAQNALPRLKDGGAVVIKCR